MPLLLHEDTPTQLISSKTVTLTTQANTILGHISLQQQTGHNTGTQHYNNKLDRTTLHTLQGLINLSSKMVNKSTGMDDTAAAIKAAVPKSKNNSWNDHIHGN